MTNEPQSKKNLSQGFLTRSYSNPPAQLQRLAGILQFWLLHDMMLPNERMIKVLIRRFASFVVRQPEDKFSHVEAQIHVIVILL